MEDEEKTEYDLISELAAKKYDFAKSDEPLKNDFNEFLSEYYSGEIQDRISKGKKHLIVDFRKLSEYSLDLADLLLTDPERAMSVMNYALAHHYPDFYVNSKDLPLVRFKNLSKEMIKPISDLRNTDVKGLVALEGMIKSQTDLIGRVTSVKYNCLDCGTVVDVKQQSKEDIKKPAKCKCGSKRYVEIGNESENYFVMSLEEVPENKFKREDYDKLVSVQLICGGSLSDSSLYNKIKAGLRIRASGILRKLYKKNRKGGFTTDFTWFLDVNYIAVLDADDDLLVTADDEKNFKKLAKKKNILDVLSNEVFYSFHGREEIKKGLLLQCFGGTVCPEGKSVRAQIHILMVGEPSTGKSEIIERVLKLVPRSRLAVATQASGVGLTASVQKDEYSGQYIVSAGAIVLASGSVLAIDEFDKMAMGQETAMNSAMEQGYVLVDKANIHAKLIAKTSIIASANPREGGFSKWGTSLISQVTMDETFRSRFDLIFLVQDFEREEDDYAVSKIILSRGSLAESREIINPLLEYNFIKKYVNFARRLKPQCDDNIISKIQTKYVAMRKKQREILSGEKQSKDLIAVNTRTVSGIRRLAEASAKSRLSETVTEKDIEIASKLILFTHKKLGGNPDMPGVEQIVIGHDKTGQFKTMSKKDISYYILRKIKAFCVENKVDTMGEDELLAVLEDKGVDELDLREYITKLKSDGDLSEPRYGKFEAV